MAFAQAESRVPTGVQSIKVSMFYYPDAPTEDPEVFEDIERIGYELIITDQDGGQIRIPKDIGNMSSHLTPEEISWLRAFIQKYYAQAEIEIIP